jgi:multidrug efflux system membrane fusion protein
MKSKIYLFILLAFVLLAYGISCRREEVQPQKAEVVYVKTAPVEHAEMSQSIHTHGRISSKKEIKLSFKINGIIRDIYVDEGEAAKKGQLLARLDLSEIESQVEQARSAFEKAQRDLKRAEDLHKDKAVTLEQLQNIRTAHQVAKSQLEIAEFNLRYAEIHAPTNGRILRRLMEENEMVSAGMPIFFFASTERDWIVRAGVSDRDLVRLRLNDPAVLRFDAYPGETFQARVSEIAESSDPMTGTYEVELKVNATDIKLVSGFVAQVDISPSSKEMYTVIPIEALVEADGRQGFVFTVDESTNRARRIPMTIGFLFEDKVAVASGLEDIKSVVTEGAPFLIEGTQVKIVETESSKGGTQDSLPESDESIEGTQAKSVKSEGNANGIKDEVAEGNIDGIQTRIAESDDSFEETN